MTHPLVSIVIPVFNGADLVGEAIESALSQSWPATEVIVVDDGSNDGGATQGVVSRFGDAVRLVAKRNGGVATALNAGLDAMRGDWFTWLSHDDIYHPERVARHMAVLLERPAGTIAFGDADEIAEDGSFVTRRRHTAGFPEDGGVDEAVWAVLEARLNGCAMTIPRACLVAAGGFDPGLPTTQDYALWHRLASRHPFVPVPGAFVRQRTHAGQGSRVARHLDEVSLLWAGFIESLEARGGTAEEVLSRLLRVARTLDQTGFLGTRMLVEERLRQATGAFAVDVVLRRAGAPAHVAMAVALVEEVGARVGRVSVVDEGRWDEPALAQALRARLPGEDVTYVRSGVDPSPERLVRLMLGSGTGALAVLFDVTAPPDSAVFRHGLRSVAAGGCDLWCPPGTAATTMVASRRALEAAASAGAPHEPGLRGVFSRLNGASTGEPWPRPLPLPPLLAPRQARPAPRPLQAGVRWTPTRAPDPGLPTLLLMLHDWGGGTERYVQLVGQHLTGRANVLYGTAHKERLFRLSSVGADTPEVEWNVAAGGLDGPVAALRALGVGQVDVLHTIGFQTWIEDFLDALAVPFDVTLLDYHLMASRPHLTDASGRFVGDAALDDSTRSARREPPSALLQGARRIIACSRDLAWRASRLTGLDIIPVEVPEPSLFPGFAIQAAEPLPGEPLRVVCVGRIARHKGWRDIADVAQLAGARGFPLKIYCLGEDVEAFPPELQQSGIVEVLGGYDEAMLQPMLCALRPHLAWLPFRAPETYSFSLTDCMLAGLPILATGVGAIPERVAGRDATWLVPLDEATPEVILSWLERLREARMKVPPHWLPIEHLPPLRKGFYQAEYLDIGRP